MWADDALILKGEAKRSSTELRSAKLELTEKINGWNMIALRGLPFLPCFAVGGSRLQFCAVSPPTETERYPTLHECSDIFDMTISDQRLSIMRISLNMLCAISILRAQMPTAAEIVPLYKTIDRGDECFVAMPLSSC